MMQADSVLAGSPNHGALKVLRNTIIALPENLWVSFFVPQQNAKYLCVVKATFIITNLKQ